MKCKYLFQKAFNNHEKFPNETLKPNRKIDEKRMTWIVMFLAASNISNLAYRKQEEYEM